MARAKKTITNADTENTTNVLPSTSEAPQKDERDVAISKLQEQNAELEAKLNALLAKLESAQNTPVAQKNDELVTVYFIAEVSKDNVLELPEYGSLRYGSYLDIPKREFGGKFMSPLARLLIDKRELLVLNGLTQEERVRWNCDYKEGEVLTERAFDHILDYSLTELKDIADSLCAEHLAFVASRFITAKENNDNRITLEKAQLLNNISKKYDKNGMFAKVISAFKAEIE